MGMQEIEIVRSGNGLELYYQSILRPHCSKIAATTETSKRPSCVASVVISNLIDARSRDILPRNWGGEALVYNCSMC